MNEYFISDPHFGHRLMAKLRGFSSTTEHDRFLYRAWLESLPENQQLKLWILGDNHCGDVAAETAALKLLSQFVLLSALSVRTVRVNLPYSAYYLGKNSLIRAVLY